MTLMEALSKATSLVIKSLLNLGILLLQEEFEEIWPEQPTSGGAGGEVELGTVYRVVSISKDMQKRLYK